MTKFDHNQVYREIITYSLKPNRFKIIVRMIRKLVWPIIRPFHFYHIQELDDVRARITESIRQNLLTLEEKIETIEKIGTIEKIEAINIQLKKLELKIEECEKLLIKNQESINFTLLKIKELENTQEFLSSDSKALVNYIKNNR